MLPVLAAASCPLLTFLWSSLSQLYCEEVRLEDREEDDLGTQVEEEITEDLEVSPPSSSSSPPESEQCSRMFLQTWQWPGWEWVLAERLV